MDGTSNGTSISHRLVSLFHKLIFRDQALFASIPQRSTLVIINHQVVFSLKDLFGLINQDEPSLTYKEFRSVLYVTNINESLYPLGFKVDIYDSAGAVDTALYCLTPIPVSF